MSQIQIEIPFLFSICFCSLFSSLVSICLAQANASSFAVVPQVHKLKRTTNISDPRCTYTTQRTWPTGFSNAHDHTPPQLCDSLWLNCVFFSVISFFFRPTLLSTFLPFFLWETNSVIFDDKPTTIYREHWTPLYNWLTVKSLNLFGSNTILLNMRIVNTSVQDKTFALWKFQFASFLVSCHHISICWHKFDFIRTKCVSPIHAFCE